MQSTTSRKNWWLVDYSHVFVQICSDEITVLDGFGVTSKLKRVISNDGVWLGHSLDFFPWTSRHKVREVDFCTGKHGKCAQFTPVAFIPLLRFYPWRTLRTSSNMWK